MNHDLDRSGTDDCFIKDKFTNDSFGGSDLTDRPALTMVWVFIVIIALVLGLFVGAYLKMTILY